MSTTPTPTPPPLVHSTLDTILQDLDVATQVLTSTGVLIPGFGTAIAGGAALADRLIKIVEGARAAHLAILGKPLDLTLLKDEAPVT